MLSSIYLYIIAPLSCVLWKDHVACVYVYCIIHFSILLYLHTYPTQVIIITKFHLITYILIYNHL